MATANADLFGLVRQTVEQNVAAANEIAEKVKASRVNVGKAVADIRQDPETTDDTVKKFQAWLEKLDATREAKITEINDYIKSNLVKASEMSDAEFEAEKEKYKSLKSEITSMMALTKKMPGYTEDVFAEVPALLTLAGGTSGGTGTGPKRPRLASAQINGDDVFAEKKIADGEHAGETQRYVTFTVLAAKLNAELPEGAEKIKPTDLSAAAFETAGTDDLSTVTDVEFVHSVGDKSWTIRVYPQQSGE